MTDNFRPKHRDHSPTEQYVRAVRAWAELQGIDWNHGRMVMTDDQAFAFRMTFQ